MIKSKGAKLSSKLPVRRSVELPRRKVLRVGRNELCPCGSGKKYKGCHAGEGEAFLQKLARQEEKQRLSPRGRMVYGYYSYAGQILDEDLATYWVLPAAFGAATCGDPALFPDKPAVQ